jgi:DNA repair photolyase
MPDDNKIAKGEPFDFWRGPAVLARNEFKYKSLSAWNFNISVGCSHGCRFCYVPSTSAIKQGKRLAEYGVADPDAEWGEYSLLRPWDEKKFMASLKSAEKVAVKKLNADGNRAVIFCSTTDPFQVFKASTPEKTKLLNASAKALVTRALEAIRDHSTLNVRILTRSPLARQFFDLFKSFGNRLVFGMSLPTLDNRLAKVYEPNAPAPSKRLETLQAAKEAGLHVFVAIAPTYPECDESDLRKTLLAVKLLEPITVYHEPINIRAENKARIAAHAKKLGVALKTEVFADSLSWRRYALESLMLMERIAGEVGLKDCLKLWPDKALKSRSFYLEIRKLAWQNKSVTSYGKKRYRDQDLLNYKEQYVPWLETWWARISDWPGEKRNRRMEGTAVA